MVLSLAVFGGRTVVKLMRAMDKITFHFVKDFYDEVKPSVAFIYTLPLTLYDHSGMIC